MVFLFFFVFHLAILLLLSYILICNCDPSLLLLDPPLYPGFEFRELDHLGYFQWRSCERIMLVIQQVLLYIPEVADGPGIRQLHWLPHQVIAYPTQKLFRRIIP